MCASLPCVAALRVLIGCCECAPQAQQKMAELQGSKLENLSEITATPTSQLKFITDAWSQVRAPPASQVHRLFHSKRAQKHM